MTKIGSNPTLAPWRLDPGASESTLKDSAREIDASAVGNHDGKVSLSEVDAYIKVQSAKLDALEAQRTDGFSSPEMGQLRWNLLAAKSVRNVLVEKADASVIGDIGRAIAVRSAEVLLGPFFKGLDIPS